MWFVLGLVSLTVFISYRLYRKLHWSWGWDNDHGYLKAVGKPYKLQHQQDKNGTQTFRFGVVSPKAFHFRIKRETGWDRFAKAVGLSVEQCFSDPEFDEAFYVVSDHPALAKELAEVAPFRAVIKALFRDSNLIKLTCEGQHLVGQYKVKSGEPSGQYWAPAHTRIIVSALHEIADTLSSLPNTGTTRDPHVWKAAFLVSLASGVLIVGALEMFRLASIHRVDPLLESWPMVRDSALFSLALLAAWLVFTAAWLRGSSHAHIVMGEVLVSGGLGLLLGSYVFARDLNCEWDDASATIYQVQVTAKHLHRHRKSPDTYSFSIQPSVLALLPASIDVTYRDYVRYNENDLLELHVKPGLMGYPWVSKIAETRTW